MIYAILMDLKESTVSEVFLYTSFELGFNERSGESDGRERGQIFT